MDTVEVIKIGGKVAEDEDLLAKFLSDFLSGSQSKILVHGGGVAASELAKQIGLQVNMREGRRVTDADMLKVVTMVYGGLINKRIVARLQSLGGNALGLTGADLNIIKAKKRDPKPVDFGWVGDIINIHTDQLVSLLNAGIIPVLAPLTHDQSGNMLNTNADTIASEVAQALAAIHRVNLIFCFDQPGVLINGEVIQELDYQQYQRLKTDGIITDGMIPKLDLSFKALEAGVDEVRIKNALDLKSETAGTKLLSR